MTLEELGKLLVPSPSPRFPPSLWPESPGRASGKRFPFPGSDLTPKVLEIAVGGTWTEKVPLPPSWEGPPPHPNPPPFFFLMLSLPVGSAPSLLGGIPSASDLRCCEPFFGERNHTLRTGKSFP